MGLRRLSDIWPLPAVSFVGAVCRHVQPRQRAHNLPLGRVARRVLQRFSSTRFGRQRALLLVSHSYPSFPRACAFIPAHYFFSYGPRSNSLLLLHYGFAIQENTYDSVDVDATVYTGSGCFKLQCSLTRKLSLELWILARAACGGCFPQNPEARTELVAVAAVQRLLLSLRSQWQTSLYDD